MGLREQLQKAAGLFIEVGQKDEHVSPDDALAQLAAGEPPLSSASAPDPFLIPPAAKTVEHLVREAPGPDLHEISVPPAEAPAPLAADGALDFNTLYQQAGLPTSAFTAEQMVDMLATLPKELSLDAKRQTVKATLNAVGKSIGATPETIVTDASRKLAALTAYVEHHSTQITAQITQLEAEISALQAQIAEKRQAIDTSHQQQSKTADLCHHEADRLDEVLEFFSLDIPPSKYAAPQQPASKP